MLLGCLDELGLLSRDSDYRDFLPTHFTRNAGSVKYIHKTTGAALSTAAFIRVVQQIRGFLPDKITLLQIEQVQTTLNYTYIHLSNTFTPIHQEHALQSVQGRASRTARRDGSRRTNIHRRTVEQAPANIEFYVLLIVVINCLVLMGSVTIMKAFWGYEVLWIGEGLWEPYFRFRPVDGRCLVRP